MDNDVDGSRCIHKPISPPRQLVVELIPAKIVVHRILAFNVMGDKKVLPCNYLRFGFFFCSSNSRFMASMG